VSETNLLKSLPEPYKSRIEQLIFEMSEKAYEIWAMYAELHGDSKDLTLQWESVGTADDDRLVIIIGRKPAIRNFKF